MHIYRVEADLSQLAGVPVGERDYNWVLKSIALSGLNTSCVPGLDEGCQATFTGTTTITAVDRETGVTYSLAGTYYQLGKPAAQQPIDGGNIQVHR